MGNSTGLRLPEAVVDEFGLKPGQEMELVVEKGEARLRLIAEDGPFYRLEDMVAEMRRLGPAYEPPLVDWGPERGTEIIDDDDWTNWTK